LEVRFHSEAQLHPSRSIPNRVRKSLRSNEEEGKGTD